jgi:hypothetical protein
VAQQDGPAAVPEQVSTADLYAMHSLDQWRSDLRSIDLDWLPAAVPKVRRAVAHHNELTLLSQQLSDDLVVEYRDLTRQTVEILTVLSEWEL